MFERITSSRSSRVVDSNPNMLCTMPHQSILAMFNCRNVSCRKGPFVTSRGLCQHLNKSPACIDPHSRRSKVHVMFNDVAQGISSCRWDGAELIHILAQHHEHAGLKSEAEDLILVSLNAGTMLTSPEWLTTVTHSLIVPPPSFLFDTSTSSSKTTTTIAQAKKVANAIVFPTVVEDKGQQWNHAKQLVQHQQKQPVAPRLAARLAHAWMDPGAQQKLFEWYTTTVRTYPDMTALQWHTYQAHARSSPSFVSDLTTKCRSMEWYMHHVNPHLSPLWDTNENDQSRQEKESKRLGIPIHIQKEKADDNSIADVQNASGGNEPQKNPDSVAAIPKKRKPSKPLCDECLQIVQRAPPVNLDYVNVSGGHLEHPHMGARVEFTNGTSAYYVHDETRLRRNPPPFGMNHEDLVLACNGPHP